MTRRLKTVKQVMELSIQHHLPREVEPALSAEEALAAHLATLPPAFAEALRAEMALGTLVVALVPGTGGLRVSAGKPKAKRTAAATHR